MTKYVVGNESGAVSVEDDMPAANLLIGKLNGRDGTGRLTERGYKGYYFNEVSDEMGKGVREIFIQRNGLFRLGSALEQENLFLEKDREGYVGFLSNVPREDISEIYLTGEIAKNILAGKEAGVYNAVGLLGVSSARVADSPTTKALNLASKLGALRFSGFSCQVMREVIDPAALGVSERFAREDMRSFSVWPLSTLDGADRGVEPAQLRFSLIDQKGFNLYFASDLRRKK